jgi:hypothetical protein
MSKLFGYHVGKTTKYFWTQCRLRKTSIEEWLYKLQLAQYRLDIRKETTSYGNHEVIFHQLVYHGLMIAEIAEVGKNEFMLTKLNRVRADFKGKDMSTGERFCTSISTMQVLDIRHRFGLETIFNLRKQRHKKDNIGWIMLRTDEAADRFIKTVHLSMMLAPFHDFDVHGHAISGRLYLQHWKIMRDAISRPLWSNHLISRLKGPCD